MKHSNFLSSFSVTNFKAIRKSGAVRFTPFTAIIGNNGSGKSSLLEAMLTYKTMVTGDLDQAFQMWRGLEHIRNKTAQTNIISAKGNRSTKPVAFNLRGRVSSKAYYTFSSVNERDNNNELFLKLNWEKLLT